MAKGRRTARRDPRKVAAGAGIAALALVALVVALGGGGEDLPAGADGTPVRDFQDLHGLAVNPDDPSVLYAATHRGLLRGNASGWFRVGDVRDDLMGFSVHPRDGRVLWASGHPPEGGNLGVRQSTDGGLTWRTLALKGVDFHAMAVSPADPERLWGYDGSGLRRSDDGGRTWEVVHPRSPAIGSLAPHPQDADVVWAAGPPGLLRSDDGGRTFAPVRDGPHAAVGASPHDPRVLFASDRDGLLRSGDGGATWTRLDAPLDRAVASHVAFDPRAPDRVYVATYGTAIFRTDDAGATWSVVKEP